MLNSHQSNSFKHKVHGHFLFGSSFVKKKDGFKILYKTGNNEPVGKGDNPKKLDNTSIKMSNIDNVIEGGPEL